MIFILIYKIKIMSNILDKIIQLPFDETKFIKKEYEKTQIVIHHTVSGGSAKAVASFWEGRPGRISTCIIIDKEGIPYQLFSSKYSGGHIGGRDTLKASFEKFNLSYRECNLNSIGVELISWGGLKKIDNKFYNCYGGEVKDDQITHIEGGFRGYDYFDSYTQKQIETLKELLIFWKDRYGIPLDYKYEDFFEISENALKGEKGLYSHVAFRLDKSDCFPDEKLINMLKSLS